MNTPDYLWDIAVPLAVLAACAWCIPTVLARYLPHNLAALFLNAIVSALLLILLSGAYVYLSWDLSERDIMLGLDTQRIVVFVAMLRGLKSILLWGPILTLALIVQPQHWRPDLETLD